MSNYGDYIKCYISKSVNKSENGIGNVVDACSHYRSLDGGVVRANVQLYEEMKNDKSFHNFIEEMKNILRKKIEDTDLDSYIRNAP